MREIKFRAWDTITNSYTKNSIDMSHCNDGTFYPFGGNRYIIEQFTGLLDKNGREIYEGDICTYTSYWQDEEYILRSTTARSVVFWGPYYDDATAISATCWIYASDGMPVESFENEIIGNIHENPELLS